MRSLQIFNSSYATRCFLVTLIFLTIVSLNNKSSAQCSFFMNINPNPVCPGDNVSFSGFGSGLTSYLWDFGDGNTSTSQYPSHSYIAVGDYVVSVTFGNTCGADSTLYDTVKVQNNLPVTGFQSLNINPDPACPGDNISFYTIFNNTSNAYPSYLWVFGDGSTSTQSYANHSYSAVGDYAVSVTIANGCGNDTTLYDTVNVQNNLLITGFLFLNINPDPACPGDQVSFNTNSGYTSYLWDFGDGSTSISLYTNHSYSAVGDYAVSVTITNGCGNDTTLYDTVKVQNNVPVTDYPIYLGITLNPVCPGDQISFNASSSFTSWLWKFGDGDSSAVRSPGHIYNTIGNYTVALTLTNGCGNDTTLYDTVKVENNAPLGFVGLDVFSDSVCPGDVAQFLAFGGSSYAWDFGDGSTSTSFGSFIFENHSYTNTGSYPVSVIISNGCGNDTILYDSIVVGNNIVPAPSDYDYLSLPWLSSACPGDTVAFLVLPSGGTYLWDFGDGNSTSQTTIIDIFGLSYEMSTHPYSTVGTYNVTLTLTNGCGNSFTDSITVQVDSNALVNGELEFWYNTSSPCTGQKIKFWGDGGSSYQWDFGDGTPVVTSTSALSLVDHIYTTAGTYTITVEISNSCGDTAIYTDEITISPSCPTGILPRVLGVENLAGFSVYPNPNEGKFTLLFTELVNENVQVTIYDLQGRVIHNENIFIRSENGREINTANLPKGLYLLKINTADMVLTKKLLIE